MELMFLYHKVRCHRTGAVGPGFWTALMPSISRSPDLSWLVRHVRLLGALLGLGWMACGGPAERGPLSVESRVEETTLHPMGAAGEERPGPQPARAEPPADRRDPGLLRAIALTQTGERDEARQALAAAREAGAPIPRSLAFLLGETDLPPIRVVSPAPGTAPLVGPPVRVDDAPPGVQTAETSIVASPDGELLAAWGDTRAAEDGGTWRIGFAVSLDGGDSWHEGLLQSPAAQLQPVVFEADPMTAWDPRTGNFWAGGVSFLDQPEAFVARKPPGVLDFEPAVRIRADEMLVDKGFLAAGPAPEDPSTTLLHFIDRRGLHTSTDLGRTWSDLVFLGNLQGPLPRVGPRGELYAVFWNGLDGVQLLRSFDGGAADRDDGIQEKPERSFIARRLDTWGSTDGSRFPGRFRVPPLPYLAVDPVDGNVFCVYFDTARRNGDEADVDLFFTRSVDRGESWLPARPIPFGKDLSPGSLGGDQFFPWIEVDTAGGLHLVFYDTRNVDQRDDQENAHVDVYYAWSDDRGETWSEIRLTDTPFETGDVRWTAPEGQFLGDYLGLAAGGGRAHPLYAAAREGDLDIWTRRIEFFSGSAAPEPPTVPQGLTADPRSETEVRLQWLGGDPGTRTMIEIRPLLEGPPITLTAPLGATSLVLDGLDPGRPYAFRVAGRNVVGVSPWSDEVVTVPMDTAPGACEPEQGERPDLLCLLDGRFRVRVVWRDPASGDTGTGHPIPLNLTAGPPGTSPEGAATGHTGIFWFFDPANLELVVKILDATPVNGSFWVFYGTLTRVEYWLTVLDAETGTSRTYHNPPGSQCGLADTSAFPRSTPSSARSSRTVASSSVGPEVVTGELAGGRPCEPSETALCLRNRFRIEVNWRDPRTGDTGVGRVLPGTDDSAFFWFFDPGNVELVVKLIDGRRVNGHFWLFAGGLTDLEVTVHFTETLNGLTKIYRKEAFDLCGLADTAAF